MDGSLTVMLVGLDAATADEFSDDERFDVRSVDTLDELPTDRSIDAVVIAMDGRGPLELLGSLRGKAPEAAVVVVTDPGSEADGAVAIHAAPRTTSSEARSARTAAARGALRGLDPQAAAGAVHHRRRHRAAQPPGFAHVAEHHLRMADRSGTPVVFLFVRLEGAASDDDVREAAEVLLNAVRDADLRPASPTTRSPCCSRAMQRAQSRWCSRASSRPSPCTTPTRIRRARCRCRSAPCTSPGRPRASRRSSRLRDAACASAWRADPSDRPPAANTPGRARSKVRSLKVPLSQRTMLPARSVPMGTVDLPEAATATSWSACATATTRPSEGCSIGTRRRRGPWHRGSFGNRTWRRRSCKRHSWQSGRTRPLTASGAR